MGPKAEAEAEAVDEPAAVEPAAIAAAIAAGGDTQRISVYSSIRFDVSER